MSSGSKQYGLIVPQKGGSSRGPVLTRSNVFGDDSESGSDDGGDWVKKALKRESEKSVLKRTTKNQIKQALAEDPTVYQYDEVYDQIEQKKVETKAVKKDVEKKPRYIQALLQTAEKRKREAERRIERQVQREREEEGALFADKESFVTASYRQKLEEFKKLDEEEKRMERLEALADVSKQKDLTGFYRHLYRQTMGESLPGAELNKESKDEEEKSNLPSIEIKVEKSEEDHEVDNEVDGHDDETGVKIKMPKAIVKREDRRKDRHYRKRRSDSTSSSEGSGPETKVSKPEDENVDADSDLSGDSSSSSSGSESSGTGSGSEEGEITRKKNKTKRPLEEKIIDGKKKQKTEESTEVTSIKTKKDRSNKENEISNKKVKTEDIKKEKDPKENEEKVLEIAKPKINIWAKRTVGQVFEDALKRYFDRKALRSVSRLVGQG